LCPGEHVRPPIGRSPAVPRDGLVGGPYTGRPWAPSPWSP